MISKVGIVLVFISGVTFAVFVSFLPQLTNLTSEHLSLGSIPLLQTSGKDPCSSDGQSVGSLKHRTHKHLSHSAPHGHGVKLHKHIRDVDAEAQAALHLARDMQEEGKVEKAMKIYQHVLALNPHQADILNEYGEFLEVYQEDVLSAEHMYCRALVLSPTHTKAMSNRQRTLPLVEELDQAFFDRIDNKRDVLAAIPESHPGLRRMKKESYFQHIYHTTAIEGNTFSLMQTRVLVETRLAIGGKSVMEHNEILGLDAALSFINSTLIQRIGAITIEDIVQIHKRVLGFVDPISAGEFRQNQVFVGDFVPPEAKEVQKLLDEFITWLNSEDALSLHPIELAAIAHYRLVFIHPFYDGNGRTSRLLMNLILMQAGYPPVSIKVEDKHEYYKNLQKANDGDLRPFIRFIARCTEMTLDEYLWTTTETPGVTYPRFADDVFDDGRNVFDDGRTIIIDPEE